MRTSRERKIYDDDKFGPTRSVSDDNYKSLLKQIHTNEVEDTIANFEDSAILNAPVPNIDKSEEKLPRTTRGHYPSSAVVTQRIPKLIST